MKKIATNKKVYHDYHILETFEAGLLLKGVEVKSIRGGKIGFKDSYCDVNNAEMFLVGFYVAPYKQASYNNVDSVRKRKLLLHKNQIIKIQNKIKEKGLTCVPTKIYFNNKNLVKVEIGLAKGKANYDKRDSIKKKDLKRENQQLTKVRNIKY